MPNTADERLKLAREIVARHVTCPAHVREGGGDDWPEMKCTIEALEVAAMPSSVGDAVARFKVAVRKIDRDALVHELTDDEILSLAAALSTVSETKDEGLLRTVQDCVSLGMERASPQSAPQAGDEERVNCHDCGSRIPRPRCPECGAIEMSSADTAALTNTAPLVEALEPFALLAGGDVNMNDPLRKWFTVAQLQEAAQALSQYNGKGEAK